MAGLGLVEVHPQLLLDFWDCGLDGSVDLEMVISVVGAVSSAELGGGVIRRHSKTRGVCINGAVPLAEDRKRRALP